MARDPRSVLGEISTASPTTSGERSDVTTV
jgi:hypothetical protein